MNHLETDAVISVNEDLNKPEISIYPNPAADHICIKSEKEYLSYTLYNSNGNLINTSIRNNKIDLKDIPSGTYFLKFIFNTGSQYLPIIKK